MHLPETKNDIILVIWTMKNILIFLYNLLDNSDLFNLSIYDML